MVFDFVHRVVRLRVLLNSRESAGVGIVRTHPNVHCAENTAPESPQVRGLRTHTFAERKVARAIAAYLPARSAREPAKRFFPSRDRWPRDSPGRIVIDQDALRA